MFQTPVKFESRLPCSQPKSNFKFDLTAVSVTNLKRISQTLAEDS